MATYVVRNEEGLIESRHLRLVCPALQEAAARRGLDPQSLRVKNTVRNGKGDELTRCELCFTDKGPLERDAKDLPRWVVGAAEFPPTPGYAYVYDIYWPEARLSHVGSTRDPSARLKTYWRETCRGGFTAQGIFWLNERLHTDPDFEPLVEIEIHAVDDVVKAEHARRDLRRRAGWEVATDV